MDTQLKEIEKKIKKYQEEIQKLQVKLDTRVYMPNIKIITRAKKNAAHYITQKINNLKLQSLVKLETKLAKEWMSKTGYVYPQYSCKRYIENGVAQNITQIRKIQRDPVIINAAEKYKSLLKQNK